MTNVNSQSLAAGAAPEADTEQPFQALALDPLTSAVWTLREIREMCSELLEADPALAIGKRFGTLIERAEA